MRIVVAEDQIEVQRHMVDVLRENALDALGASNGADLERLMAGQVNVLLLLNAAWKQRDGTLMVNHLQARQGLHVVVLSPEDDDEHRILALDAGADNYLVTPVDPRLLLALVRRVCARFQAGTWRLQPSKRHLHTPAGVAATLTDAEVCLLEALVRAGGRTVARRQLIEALGYDFLRYDERRLEVGISRLRKKIKHATGADAPLKSGWGLGYAFTDPCVLI